MMISRIRRTGAYLGLVAAMSLAAPVGASAAVPGQPTPTTISAEAVGSVGRTAANESRAEGVQVAGSRQNLRRNRAQTRRNFRRSEARNRANVRRANVRRARPAVRRAAPRPVVRRNYARGYRAGYRNGYRHYYRGRWYTYRDNRWYDDGGAIVAAGVIGLAAGALAGSAYANSGNTTVVVNDNYDSGDWYRACANKYRSFRASDGTYLGYDGLRHRCRLP